MLPTGVDPAPASVLLKVSVESIDGAVVVHLIGDAGVPNVDELIRKLTPLSAQHAPLVIFDISQLTFISSLGLGALMQFQRGLHRHGGKMRLIGPSAVVRDMLAKCRLDTVLIVANSKEEALASLSAG